MELQKMKGQLQQVDSVPLLPNVCIPAVSPRLGACQKCRPAGASPDLLSHGLTSGKIAWFTTRWRSRSTGAIARPLQWRVSCQELRFLLPRHGVSIVLGVLETLLVRKWMKFISSGISESSRTSRVWLLSVSVAWFGMYSCPKLFGKWDSFWGPLSDADGCSSFSIRIMAELLLQDHFESFGPAPSSRTSETTLNVVELPEWPCLSVSKDTEREAVDRNDHRLHRNVRL